MLRRPLAINASVIARAASRLEYPIDHIDRRRREISRLDDGHAGGIQHLAGVARVRRAREVDGIGTPRQKCGDQFFLFLRREAAVAEQQMKPFALQHGIHPAHDLGDDRMRHARNDGRDDAGAARLQAAGDEVGDVADRPDGLQHARPRRLRDPRRVREDTRDTVMTETSARRATSTMRDGPRAGYRPPVRRVSPFVCR